MKAPQKSYLGGQLSQFWDTAIVTKIIVWQSHEDPPPSVTVQL